MTVVLGVDTATAYAVVALTRESEPVREASVPPAPDRPLVTHRGCSRRSSAASRRAGAGSRSSGSRSGSARLLHGAANRNRHRPRARAGPRRPDCAGGHARGPCSRDVRTPEAQEHGLLPVIDARRGEAFAALYDHDGAELWAPLVAPPNELRRASLGAGFDPAGGRGRGATIRRRA